MPFRPIKVLIADDSSFLRSELSEAMIKDPAFDTIKTAGTFSEAASLMEAFGPDVVLAGGQPGVSMVKTGSSPVVIMLRPGEDAKEVQWKGAADFVALPKDRNSNSCKAFCNEICVKVKIAAMPSSGVRTQKIEAPHTAGIHRIILIGASTGGTDATAEIIKHLPGSLPGIVIVQHMPSGFTKMYAQRLDGLGEIHVSEAKNGDRVKRGCALLAPGGLHLSLKKDADGYYVQCNRGERVNGHCPSVGVLFDSAAKVAGSEAIGVLLTGMGKDGAEGLLHMRQAGAYTIGQDRETSVVYGMPMAAYEIGAVMQQAPLQQIANLIVLHLK